MKKGLLIIHLIFLFAALGLAQEVRFSASVTKNKVAVGERFRVTFSINTNASSFSPPDLSDFSVVSGPNQSSNFQMTPGGGITQNLSYFYDLVPQKEGSYTIGPASIVVGNGRVKSNSIEIVVSGTKAQGQQGQNQQSNRGQNPPAESQVPTEGNNLYIKAIVNKSEAYLGEAIHVKYKLFTRYNLVNFSDLKFPSFTGFYAQDLATAKNVQLAVENIGGVNYYTLELKQSVLFAQKSGKLEIPTLEAECIIRERVQSQNIFDQFFGGSYRDQRVKVKSKPLGIQINPLPTNGKPAHFNGAVGKFGMEVSTDKRSGKSGDAFTLKVRINGTGNLKLSEQPSIAFPPEFEVYDPQINEQIQTTEQGMTGSRTFEYLMIPRAGGNYTIGPIEYTYFDPTRKTYVDISSEAIQLSIAKSAGEETVVSRSGNQSSPKVLGSDIRYNKTNTPEFKPIGDGYFFGTLPYYILLLAPLLGLGFIFIFKRIRNERSENAELYRKKGAGPIARKRLKVAAAFMNKQDDQGFYQEISKALYGYVTDKMELKGAELSRDRIKEVLQHNKIGETVITEFIALIDRCEFARYAPQTEKGTSAIYEEAGRIIESLDKSLKQVA